MKQFKASENKVKTGIDLSQMQGFFFFFKPGKRTPEDGATEIQSPFLTYRQRRGTGHRAS